MTNESRVVYLESFGLERVGHYENRRIIEEDENDRLRNQSSISQSCQDLAPEMEEER